MASPSRPNMTTYVKASCHCRLNAFNIAFATDSLPVNNDLCHCNSCRHSSGQLMADYVKFAGVPLAPASYSEPADLTTLTPYKSSTIATRWFCTRCSAHILWEYHNAPTPSWYVATGTLERVEGIIKTTYHIWIGDTLDGGIADHIPKIDGIELTRYAASDATGELLPVGWRDPSVDPTKDHLHAYCNCKANEFFITRPSASQSVSPTTWWLRSPGGSPHPTHYLAAHCPCTSCRTTSGFEIQSWAFVPFRNIFVRSDTGELAELDLKDPEKHPSGLTHYSSSEGKHREFCGTCGATAFYWTEGRPDLVDVAVALVDEQQVGSRAEGWFDWYKQKLSFVEDAVNVKLVDGLLEGLKASKK